MSWGSYLLLLATVASGTFLGLVGFGLLYERRMRRLSRRDRVRP